MPISSPLLSVPLAWLVTLFVPDELPKVEGVEAPATCSPRRGGLVEAMELLGQPLPPANRTRTRGRAMRRPDRVRVGAAVQEVLDPLCLVGVEINPESRVKAGPGPAPASARRSRAGGSSS